MRTMLGAVLVLLAGTGRAADGPGWPQYGGGNRDFVRPAAVPGDGADGVWERDLGPGTSGIVSDGTVLVTMYSVPNPKQASEGVEVVVCLDRRTGKTLWDDRTPVARLKGQESYSGDPIRPQATPAISGSRVCTLGSTGLLKCFDVPTGKVVWQHDLVADFGAKPVQFGFAASPLVAGGRFVVHAGGAQAAVIAFNSADGAVVWKSKPAEPSYSSPVLMPSDRGDVVVQMTRDAVFGFAAADGRQRWTYALPKPGLTNVPTPIVLSKRRLLISGQGVLGTRLLEVAATGDAVAEVWKNDKVAFFYANWLTDGAAVYGSADKFLRGLRLSDGKELWREQGQADANLLQVGPDTVVLRGDGQFTHARLSPTGFEDVSRVERLAGRCWAAPTLVGDTIYARSESKIRALKLSSIFKP